MEFQDVLEAEYDPKNAEGMARFGISPKKTYASKVR